MKTTTYRVKFFSARHSRAGKGGVRVAYFLDKAKADEFAAGKRLYSAPAKVELVEPLTAKQRAVVHSLAPGGAL